MDSAIVVPRGRSIVLLEPSSSPREFPFDPGSTGASPGLLAALELAGRRGPVAVGGPPLLDALASARVGRLRPASRAEWHAALQRFPPAELARERAAVLTRAREDLEAALRAPDEVLIALAREEERLARAVGRERRAAEAFVAVPGTVLADYARAWEGARGTLAEHHRALRQRLEAEATRLLPNLSAVVGPRTAARLVAAAGGTAPLAKMAAARLQLLGARRRPSADRGPRYGTIYLADALDDVPPDRRGAFARSLAAMAAIAARADLLTHRDLSASLLARRDARRASLRRRRA